MNVNPSTSTVLVVTVNDPRRDEKQDSSEGDPAVAVRHVSIGACKWLVT